MLDTFVINLDSRPDRWALIEERFSSDEFNLERIPAVVKPVGAYGNFLSMIKAIKIAKKRGLDEVLIVEDDCLPKHGFEKNWSLVKSWLDTNPDKWELFSGGSLNLVGPQLIGQIGKIKLYNPVWATAAHWIYLQKRSYNKVLKYYESVSVGANYISLMGVNVHNNFLKTVVSVPFIAYQDDGYSNISKMKRKTRKQFRNCEKSLEK